MAYKSDRAAAKVKRVPKVKKTRNGRMEDYHSETAPWVEPLRDGK